MAPPPELIDLRRILVGLDGSDNAQHALEWAILIAEMFEAEVVAVHAVGVALARIGWLPGSEPLSRG